MVEVPSGRIVRRSIGLLCPFELGESEVDSEERHNVEDPTNDRNQTTAMDDSRRPMRRAALEARRKVHTSHDNSSLAYPSGGRECRRLRLNYAATPFVLLVLTFI
jgi:hypothetical protein